MAGGGGGVPQAGSGEKPRGRKQELCSTAGQGLPGNTCMKLVAPVVTGEKARLTGYKMRQK